MTTQLEILDVERDYTLDEFMDLDLPEGYRYELIEGKLEMSPQPGGEHGKISTLLAMFFGIYVYQNNLGQVWTNGTFEFGPKTGLAPDLAFVVTSRLPASTEKAVPVIPDLVIEIRSPSDRKTKIINKVRRYQKAGVRLIWLVEPKKRVVQVYHQNDQTPTTLHPNAELDGEDIVAGFKLEVSKLFAWS